MGCRAISRSSVSLSSGTQKCSPLHFGDRHETVFISGTGFFAGTPVGVFLVDEPRPCRLQRRTTIGLGPRRWFRPRFWRIGRERRASLRFGPRRGLRSGIERGHWLRLRLGWITGLG